MNYNTDGFNERTNYIRNCNDINRLRGKNVKLDNSFAKMRVEENKPDIKTYSNEVEILNHDVRGNKENFIIRNNNIRNMRMKVSSNNPVSDAINKNNLRRF